MDVTLSTTTDGCSQMAWQGPSAVTAFGVPVVGGGDVGARGTRTMSLDAKSRSHSLSENA